MTIQEAISMVESAGYTVNKIDESKFGRFLGTAALAGTLFTAPSQAQNNDTMPVNNIKKELIQKYEIVNKDLDSDGVISLADKLIDEVKFEMIEKNEFSNIENISAWKDIEIVYDTLSKQNKNLANLLARKINAELHNKLKIAKMIGS